jgi:hypothetical protein
LHSVHKYPAARVGLQIYVSSLKLGVLKNAHQKITEFYFQKVALIFDSYPYSFPITGRAGPEGSRKLMLPGFLTTAQYVGRLSATAAFNPRNIPGTYFPVCG